MDNEYVYHTVFICRGATRDMCVTRKFPMIGRAGLEEIRQALHAYLRSSRARMRLSRCSWLHLC